MAGTDTRNLEIVLTAKDLASRQLRGISNEMGKLGGNTNKLRGIFDNFGSSLANTGRSFLSLQGAIAGVGLTLLIADVAKAGANLERMEAVTKVLSKNLGIGADTLKEYRDALAEVNTFGGSATQTINTFLQSGIAGTIDFKKFISVTKDFAAAAGVSSKDAIESFTKALTTMRPELLEQFGIQFNLTQLYKEFSQELGKTSSELTQVEKRQALLNEIFRQGEAVAGVYSETYKTAGKNLLSIKDAMQNVKEFLGSALVPAMREFTSVILNELKKSVQWFENNRDAVSEFGEKLAKVAVVGVKAIGNFVKFLIKNKEIILGLFAAIAISIGVAVAAMLPALLSAHGAFLILWGIITLLLKSGIVKWFTGLNSVVKVFVGLGVAIPIIGIALSSIIPAVITLGTTFGVVFGGIATLITGTVLPALGAVAVAFAPIALPILAIVAVLGLLFLAWKTNFLGIQDITNQFVENFRASIQLWTDAFNLIVTWIQENIIPLFKQTLPETIAFFMGLWLETTINFINFIIEAFSQLPGRLLELIKRAVSFIVEQFKSLMAFVQQIVPAIVKFILENWKNLPEIGKKIFTEFKDNIVEQFKSLFDLSKAWVDKVVGLIDSIISKAREAIDAVAGAFQSGRESGASFQFGGFVPQTGVALLHRGEFVVSKAMIEGTKSVPTSVSEVFNQPITIQANINNEVDFDLLGDKIAFALRNSRN